MDIERPIASVKSAQIAFLLSRQFGSLAGSRPWPKSDELPPASPRDLKRAEYEAMTDEQIAELHATARQQDADAEAARARAEEAAHFFNRPHADADFPYWCKMAFWTLDEAVVLSLGKHPNVVNWKAINNASKHSPSAFRNSPLLREYARRCELARRAQVARELHTSIAPEVFLTWALQMFDSLPAELVEGVRAQGKQVNDIKTLLAQVAELESTLAAGYKTTNNKWPWGTHETALLRQLESTAKHFWTNYDPADATTARTNEEITAWLEQRGVSRIIAQKMATILRADGLSTGPRR